MKRQLITFEGGKVNNNLMQGAKDDQFAMHLLELELFLEGRVIKFQIDNSDNCLFHRSPMHNGYQTLYMFGPGKRGYISTTIPPARNDAASYPIDLNLAVGVDVLFDWEKDQIIAGVGDLNKDILQGPIPLSRNYNKLMKRGFKLNMMKSVQIHKLVLEAYPV